MFACGDGLESTSEAVAELAAETVVVGGIRIVRVVGVAVEGEGVVAAAVVAVVYVNITLEGIEVRDEEIDMMQIDGGDRKKRAKEVLLLWVLGALAVEKEKKKVRWRTAKRDKGNLSQSGLNGGSHSLGRNDEKKTTRMKKKKNQKKKNFVTMKNGKPVASVKKRRVSRRRIRRKNS